jgi:hypothetical protein
MKGFVTRLWDKVKGLGKGRWLDIAQFLLLVLFYAIIPFILFTEAYGGATNLGTRLSLGFCIGMIVILIVCKKMFINNHIATLRTRIGVMTDSMNVETDPVKKYNLARRIAFKNMLLTALNLIIPIFVIVTVVCVAITMQTTAEAFGLFKRTIYYSSISFAFGVVVQIAFPFIKAALLREKD